MCSFYIIKSAIQTEAIKESFPHVHCSHGGMKHTSPGI